ncbi:hypothetical protein [Pelosinus propionicus]|uniref:Uncharacterized protein n=1 Tax=Pelosinus propionicus DSM 13327 TaxID=1123291 RepID=A0A1I4N7V3_9FIRM|nr:hypothetical protein [Pelosinus propionicus]SFM11591.1 hypothetical protein SAMN04490355_104216 [Pelosinus propionicus DSM 13327]
MGKTINFPSTNIAEEEATIETQRSEKFHASTRIISDFICNLSLSVDDNNHLIALLVEQLQEAERTAFLQGFDMGCKTTKAYL